jgi:hypothetical protein
VLREGTIVDATIVDAPQGRKVKEADGTERHTRDGCASYTRNHGTPRHGHNPPRHRHPRLGRPLVKPRPAVLRVNPPEPPARLLRATEATTVSGWKGVAVAAVDEARHKATMTASTSDRPRAAERGMAHLLLIDDGPALMPGRLRQLFAAPVHRVEVAATGAKGLKRIEARRTSFYST